MDLALLEIAVIVTVVIAIINRVKAEAPVIADYWYTIMAFGIGAIVYVIVLFAPATVTTILFIGLAASGIYDIFKK
tara:strand:- start:407 stop:634 length:228 start_codon:yes stop_codon:yes gene_type:complete